MRGPGRDGRRRRRGQTSSCSGAHGSFRRRFGTGSEAPVYGVTNPTLAVVRFHGRNARAWAKRGADVAEKYDWLYSEDDLREWVPPIQRMAAESESVHVLMNNCREDKAVVNARQLAMLLWQADPAS